MGYDDAASNSSGENSPTTATPPSSRVRPNLINMMKPQDDSEPFENDRQKTIPPRPALSAFGKSPDDSSFFKKGGASKSDTMDQTSALSLSSSQDYSKQQLMTSDDKRMQSKKKVDELQDVMKDNLELMYDIVMQIRENEEYARSIYKDCPRLQNLLDQHPDLRPLFEDPNLVRINFEKVYRDAGGVLPEDDDKKSQFMKIIGCIVNHPLFKVFKLLLLVKKIFVCISSGGINMIKSCCAALFGTSDPMDDDRNNPNNPNNIDPDSDPENMNNPANANKIALQRAAEHMEDPDVQKNMQDLLENDPEALDDAIENDPELKALRDSNPLCAELMSDPETMKILTDPENLRALSDAPELIEQDFNDPNWTPPVLEEPPDDLLDDDGAAYTGTGPDGADRNGTSRGPSVDANGEPIEDNEGLGEGGGEDTDFELGDSKPIEDEEGVGEAGLEDNDGTYEDFELGDSQNVHAEDNDATYEDFELDDGQNNDNAVDDNDGTYEDFELGDSQNNNNAAEDNGGTYEDFELGESNNNGQEGEEFELGESAGNDVGHHVAEEGLEDSAIPDDLDLVDDNNNDLANKADATGEEAVDSEAGADGVSTYGGQQKKREEEEEGPRSQAGTGAGGTFFAQVTTGLTDFVVGEMVGMGFSEMTGGMNQGSELVDLDKVDAVAEYAEEATDAAENTQQQAVRNAGDMDPGMMAGGPDQQQQQKKGEGEERAETEGTATREAAGVSPKKGRLGKFGGFISTTLKEHVAGQFIGEDFGEMLAEKLDERKAEKERRQQEGGASASATEGGPDGGETGAQEEKRKSGLGKLFTKKQE